MKVILLKDVAKIGRKASVVEVPDGYALNKLIPGKMAEPATPVNLKKIAKLKSDLASSQEADKAHFVELKKVLTEKVLKIAMDVNEKGHSFKAVSENDILAAAQELGMKFDPATVVIAKPIKELGEHEVQLVLGANKANLTIEVVKK